MTNFIYPIKNCCKCGLIAFSLIAVPLKTLAQSEINLPPNAPDTIERTTPQRDRSLPSTTPQPQPQPNLEVPAIPQTSECINPNQRNFYSDRLRGELFYVRDVEVMGNTVLQGEIEQEIAKFKRHVATFEDLVCLRSQITNLYLSNGYITSGAFIPNNQDLENVIVKIQVVEGDLSEIAIAGLNRLRSGYIRSRLQAATSKPLNRQRLESALQLLLLDPLIERVDAELTASSTPGSNILLLNIQETDPFFTGIGADNYRSASIGETQLTAAVTHNNLFGFGDRVYADYSLTEGLDLYNLDYAIPVNAQDGTLSFNYDNSNSNIVDEEFEDLDIASETESFSFGWRQPIVKTPNTELALGFNLDLRRRQSPVEILTENANPISD